LFLGVRSKKRGSGGEAVKQKGVEAVKRSGERGVRG